MLKWMTGWVVIFKKESLKQEAREAAHQCFPLPEEQNICIWKNDLGTLEKRSCNSNNLSISGLIKLYRR